MAAALPGMDSTPEKSKEDSILVLSSGALPVLMDLTATLLQIGLAVGIDLAGVLQGCG